MTNAVAIAFFRFGQSKMAQLYAPKKYSEFWIAKPLDLIVFYCIVHRHLEIFSSVK